MYDVNVEYISDISKVHTLITYLPTYVSIAMPNLSFTHRCKKASLAAKTNNSSGVS